MMESKETRRDFLKQSLAGAAALAWAGQATAQNSGGIPTRRLGRTNEQVSMLGLGGHHAARIKDDNEVVALIREAIDSGVTFLDNAWEYHNGRAEELMGRALRDGYRGKAFLMTKHHGRDKKTALEHLDDSLRRLETDVIDLWQFHEVVYAKDPEMIHTLGGIEAAEEAKKAGKVRYIGFTGHKDPAIFKDMLDRGYAWDAVQMPINAFDAHFMSFATEILPILIERDIGVIAMKTLGDGHILKANVIEPAEALRYAWSQPVSVALSGMNSLDILRTNVALARNFTAMPEAEQQTLLAKTRDAALTGTFEPFKTTQMYDGMPGRKLHGLA